MKSSDADEIAFGGYKTDLISSKPYGFDFIQTCLDFIVHCTISLLSLKECYETEHWLELMQKSEILLDFSKIIHDCGVIRKMLISSINTAKKNQN